MIMTYADFSIPCCSTHMAAVSMDEDSPIVNENEVLSLIVGYTRSGNAL